MRSFLGAIWRRPNVAWLVLPCWFGLVLILRLVRTPLALVHLFGLVSGNAIREDFGEAAAYRLTRFQSRLEILDRRWAFGLVVGVGFFAVVFIFILSEATPLSAALTSLSGIGAFALGLSLTRPGIVRPRHIWALYSAQLIPLGALMAHAGALWTVPVLDVGLAIPCALHTIRIWKRADF